MGGSVDHPPTTPTYRRGHRLRQTDASSGNAWENLALFDFEDRALPGLRTHGRYRS
ncbi:hypothetical protein [Streptomyces sp. LUP47B]|uniref:hypothetical protein n=1 Tax=Streptomyces sp. LUP47B TaxID=1890286 RepID=UPI00159F134F|nr:hypothetical protein [Streptomyces sp. LUP47B]